MLTDLTIQTSSVMLRAVFLNVAYGIHTVAIKCATIDRQGIVANNQFVDILKKPVLNTRINYTELISRWQRWQHVFHAGKLIERTPGLVRKTQQQPCFVLSISMPNREQQVINGPVSTTMPCSSSPRRRPEQWCSWCRLFHFGVVLARLLDRVKIRCVLSMFGSRQPLSERSGQHSSYR